MVKATNPRILYCKAPANEKRSDGTTEKAKGGNERNPRIDAQETSGSQVSVVESTGDKR